MTTIAYRNKVMAGDTAVTSDGQINYANINKIRKVEGCLVGGCGSIDAVNWFLNKFELKYLSGKHFMLQPLSGPLKDDDLEAIVISPTGKVFHVEEKLLFTPVKIKGYVAVGSGTPYAYGALHKGATAVEAVKVAMKYDYRTGGRVQTIRLGR